MSEAFIDMRELMRTAIMARFDAQPEHYLHAALAGRLAYVRAVDGWPLPFGYFAFAALLPDDAFGGQREEAVVRFFFYGTTAAEVERLCNACLDRFDGQTLQADGLEPFTLYRSGSMGTMDAGDGDLAMWVAGVELTGRITVA